MQLWPPLDNRATADHLVACLPTDQSALVTYVTAGYPKPENTPQVLLAMEKGGAGEPQRYSL